MFGHKYRYIFILLLGIYSHLNTLFVVGDRLFSFPINAMALLVTIMIIVFLTWEGNRGIEKLIPPQPKIGNQKVHPLVLQFGMSILLVLAISILVVSLSIPIFNMPGVSYIENLRLSLAFTFRINLFLNIVNAVYFFSSQLKKAQLEAEELKKISVEAQFEALRNQINPHFLFNSFNVLSSLVYKDPETSNKFIEQLSVVYRYLLYHQENKLVKLKDELEFMQSYQYLLSIRFGEGLTFSVDVNGSSDRLYIVPAALQMLVENAIKHNVVSQRKPLRVNIEQLGEKLVISNNIQEKLNKEPSTSVGLNNIMKRYQLLAGDKIEVLNDGNHFQVSLPLIPEANESTNR